MNPKRHRVKNFSPLSYSSSSSKIRRAGPSYSTIFALRCAVPCAAQRNGRPCVGGMHLRYAPPTSQCGMRRRVNSVPRMYLYAMHEAAYFLTLILFLRGNLSTTSLKIQTKMLGRKIISYSKQRPKLKLLVGILCVGLSFQNLEFLN